MYYLTLTIHLIACVLMIIAVLLQAGKGADIGAVFGGAGGQALFGSSGPVDFLNKATRVLVVIFMLTSLTLGYFVAFEKPASNRSIMNTPPIQKTVPGVPDGAAAPQPQPAAPAVPATPPQQPAAPAK
jgi:preprotein translocase subunit SecG